MCIKWVVELDLIRDVCTVTGEMCDGADTIFVLFLRSTEFASVTRVSQSLHTKRDQS